MKTRRLKKTIEQLIDSRRRKLTTANTYLSLSVSLSYFCLFLCPFVGFVFVFEQLMASLMIELTTTDAHLGYPGSDQEASFQTGSWPLSWCDADAPASRWCSYSDADDDVLASVCQHHCCCSWHWPYEISDVQRIFNYKDVMIEQKEDADLPT